MSKCPVTNWNVYGLEESIRAAKYPKCTHLETLNSDLTSGIKSLAQSAKGEGHDQWLTGVTVQFDLTFSNKAWVEAERYRFLYFVSSQSTMHKMTKFDLNVSYNEYVDPRVIEIMKDKVTQYNLAIEAQETGRATMNQEELAKMYLEILYTNPSGFELTARLTTNYRELKTIYAQRKTHRLPEWREFCKWVETLPMSFLITGDLKCQ